MYRQILENEFLKRVKANNSYSMRAFARDLKISSSFLTSLLKNKRNLSEIKAKEISNILRLSTIEAKIFILSATAESSRKDSDRALAEAELLVTLEEHKLTKKFNLDEFKKISDWTYLATLALFQTYNFKCTADLLSKRLGISFEKAEEVINTLEDMSYITKSIDSFTSNILSSSTPSDIPSQDIQDYHKRIIKKSSDSLDSPVDEREFLSLTFSCDKTVIAEAKKFIREFQINFSNRFARQAKKDSVYQLSVQFFRLDKETNKEGNKYV